MTEYTEHFFNCCPECLPTKRVLLMYKGKAEFSEPCSNCRCKYGKVMSPKKNESLAWYKGLDPLPDYGTSKT